MGAAQIALGLSLLTFFLALAALALGIYAATREKGPTGAQGPAGAQGQQGVQGPQGVPGVAGVTGVTGPAGGPHLALTSSFNNPNVVTTLPLGDFYWPGPGATAPATVSHSSDRLGVVRLSEGSFAGQYALVNQGQTALRCQVFLDLYFSTGSDQTAVAVTPILLGNSGNQVFSSTGGQTFAYSGINSPSIVSYSSEVLLQGANPSSGSPLFFYLLQVKLGESVYYPQSLYTVWVYN